VSEADLLDTPPIRIPASAATPDGFREWRRGKQGRRGVSFLRDRIFIDYAPAPLGISVPASALTSLDGFSKWVGSDDFPDRGRISYIEREVWIDMSPEELETHNKVKTAVYHTAGNLNEELDLGELYTDGALVKNERADVSNEPDGTLVKWETAESGRVRYVTRDEGGRRFTEIHGTPDWVLEIVSRSSFHKDTVVLRRNYFRAGIPEYWLIDAMDDEEITFQILTRGRRGYVAVHPRGGWLKSPVFGRSFRLERRRNRAGRWNYQLQVKPV
jgi:Uma2 family endonuclease